MARGNGIVVTAEPKGRFISGYIGAAITPKPGTIMEIDPTIALKAGRVTFKLYNPGADGARPKGPYCVLMHDPKIGKTVNDAYAAGDHCECYVPLPGDELNLLVENIAGTADDHAAGELMIVNDGTGKMIATTGTPESEPFVLMETITDPTSDTLAWGYWSGC